MPLPRTAAAADQPTTVLTAALAAAPVAAPAAAPTAAPTAAPAIHPAAALAAAEVMAVLPGVMDAMRQVMRAQLHGPLTVPQFRGLNFIDHHPGSSVSALAGFLGVTLATASAMAHRLVRAGHLQAQGSLADRRRTELHLCASGKALLERMRQQTCADLACALQGRSAPELSLLVAGLQVLAQAFLRVESRDAAAVARPGGRRPATSR